MADKVEALRLQVNAAQFLLQSLQKQLGEAEKQAKAQQDNREQDASSTVPQTGPSSSGGNERNHEPTLIVAESGPQLGDDEFPGLADEVGLGDESGDEDAPNEDDDTQDMFELPPLAVDTMYPSLEDVKKAAIAHAISQGWTCGVDKRDRCRLVLKCRSDSSCPFHLRAEQYDKAARVSAYKPEHTCTFQSDQSHVPRAHAAKVRFMREQLPNFMTLNATTTAQEISDAIYQRFGTRVNLRQCRNLRVGPKRHRAPSLGTCSTCGQIGHNRKTCGRIEVP